MKEKRDNTVINPLQLQAFFDEEILDEEELIALRESLNDDEQGRLESLHEMRELLRFDSEQALEQHNPNALWNRINHELFPAVNVSVAKEPSVWERVKSFFADHSRVLVPCAVIGLLAVIALPSAISLFSDAGKNQLVQKEHTTYVFLDTQSVNPETVSYTSTKAPVIWYNGSMEAQAPTLTQSDPRQLTVQELDAAINHLIQRIETLEGMNNGSFAPKQLMLGPNDLNPSKNNY